MKTEKSERLFLVLVPHRDTRLVMRNYSSKLFKAGLTYAFPWAAPLAALSRPLNTQELKNIAHTFRKLASDGKFCAEGAYTMPFPPKEENSFLFGPHLDFTVPPDFLSGIGDPFSQTVIGACMISDGENVNALPCPPKLSFSAASVANMFLQPVNLPGATGHKWKIGKLCWLPKKSGTNIIAQSKKC
jgi:hypothetical protein